MCYWWFYADYGRETHNSATPRASACLRSHFLPVFSYDRTFTDAQMITEETDRKHIHTRTHSEWKFGNAPTDLSLLRSNEHLHSLWILCSAQFIPWQQMGCMLQLFPSFESTKKKPYTIQTIEFAHIPAQTCVHWCVILVHNIYLLSVSFRVFFSLANNKTARQFEFLRSSTVKFIAFYLNVLKCAPISIWNCIKLVPPGFTKSNYLIGQLNQQDSTGKKQKPIHFKKNNCNIKHFWIR